VSPLSQVPFTVVGGFLGAGKTSLINHLLATAKQRYAVLVNDFGALNIDEKLIKQHNGDTIALANGCICCSLAAGFSQGLGLLLDKIEQFDHVIIEASGIGDPKRIQDIARIEPQLKACGNLVLVDASAFMQQAEDPYTDQLIHQQIDAADMLLINKQSLIDNSSKRLLSDYLMQFSEAPQFYTDWSKIAASQILNLPPRNHSPNPLLKQVVNHGLSSKVLRSDDLISTHLFDQWTKRLTDNILRGKGLLNFSDKKGTWLWQLSANQSTLTPFSGEAIESGYELILIGKQKEAIPNNIC
jgi:G3E family GTPase